MYTTAYTYPWNNIQVNITNKVHILKTVRPITVFSKMKQFK